ncbi:hypothetical protein AXF42_Ash017994 [Apostasia shenzhenica]|uniref:Uncharacterized protein n=1 Tax=Apostasia shenzhenica TaxID=1088818 RepID=A0A2I0A540_9ASPA|nr:hypothetical protein AXF42_Ash017994 [Apostasia shenzhenica]
MPPAKSKRRTESICQRSGEIAFTLARVSYLYLATRMLSRSGNAGGREAGRPQRKVEEPEIRPAAYVLEPDEAVDARAEEYIRRRRERNFNSVDDRVRSEASKCIPPPPPPKNKWAATAGGGGYYGRY